jgi:hypothetical protein
MKKVIALCLLLITGLSLFGCEANPGKFIDTIYESKIKIAGKGGPKVQYCIREPEKYDFYSYEYNEDAVFTDKEIKQLTKGFSFVEEKVFKRSDQFKDYFSKRVFYDTRKELDERKARIYKKGDIQLILLDDVYYYVFSSCPFCSSENEYEESEETSKKLFEEIKNKIGLKIDESHKYSFTPYEKSSEDERCKFYMYGIFNDLMFSDPAFAYVHDKEHCYFAGTKLKISKGDKITEHIITGEELIEVYEDRLTNSSIYYNNTAPALKHSCQLYYRPEYDEDEKKWKCRLEWVVVCHYTPAIPDFNFSPLGHNPNYVTFDAITGDLGWSQRDIW